MRQRLRHVVAAAFLLFGTILLFSQYQSELLEAYPFQKPYGTSAEDANDGAVPDQTQANRNDDGLLDIPLPLQPDSASGFPQNGPSSDNMPMSEVPQPQSNPPITNDVPDMTLTGGNQAMSESNSNPPVFEAEFPFQEDLELELPIEILREFSNKWPLNYDPNGPKTNAYATFMATRNPSLKDPYLLAIHSLIYRILWSPRSRTESYPFVVFVGDFVTPEQRQLLSGAGAVVRELAPLEWNPNVPDIQHRWKDLFAKLNMWKEIEFSRILFLDADAFPVANIDTMFHISPTQDCIESKLEADDYLADGTPVCEPYVFAGIPQDPFNALDVNINVGSLVFAPSERMHERLLQNYVKTDRYNCLMAEQAFLNWQFNLSGPFPPSMLEREYGGFFPSEDEEGKLKVVHEKLWSEDREWMKGEWVTQWQEMLAFYTSAEFRQKREGSQAILR